MMLVAVAGASGRVGRRLLSYLKSKGIRAVALVRSRASIARLPKNTPYKLVHFDTGWGLADALKNATHVVNLTGSVDTSLSQKELYDANVVPTSHLLSAAPLSIRRFVHVSSIAVYPKHPRGPVDENHHRAPADPYGRTKLEGERIAIMHAQRLPITILEPAIIYGPGFASGFHAVLERLAKGEMAVIGKGDNRFPLIHVDDVVSAIHQALLSDVPSGSVFIIASAQPLTQTEALTLAADALGVPAPRSHVPASVAKLGAVFSTLKARIRGRESALSTDMVEQICADRVFNPERARRLLGWSARIGHAKGIQQAVQAFMKAKRPKIMRKKARRH